ncbi:thiamine-phosphate kinase [Pseudogracilibacillus sp. SE30717A]|uniref:thiamine-phosphate kinase n=1 Tax=Pseudogracilibacillus sp. SE30717A TaxID=3098293 RepID=UPI00300DDEAD
MNEFQFIHSIKQNTYKQQSLLKGIGDDAAVFRSLDKDIVTAVDTFVENIHFNEKTMEAYDIGYKALAANISDVAAMGAQPKFYLVSIVVPDDASSQLLSGLYRGMDDIASKYRMDLIGGDTVTGKQLVLSVTIIGTVSRGKARYRNDARDKDIIFVTGTLGDSQAGLFLLMNDRVTNDKMNFIQRHRMPSPRVKFATSLQPLKRVALNDISDGIANELKEIAEASNVTIILEDDKIPTSSNFNEFSYSQQYEWKYFGGEDFELVGTASEKDWNFIKESADKIGLGITKIGNVTYDQNKNGNVYLKKEDQLVLLEKMGYIHKVGE